MEISDLQFDSSSSSSSADSGSSDDGGGSDGRNQRSDRFDVSLATASAAASYYSSYARLGNTRRTRRLSLRTKRGQLLDNYETTKKRKSKKKKRNKEENTGKDEETAEGPRPVRDIDERAHHPSLNASPGSGINMFSVALQRDREQARRCLELLEQRSAAADREAAADAAKAHACWEACFERLRDPFSSRLAGAGTVSGEAVVRLLLRVGAFPKGWLGKSASFRTLYGEMQRAVGNDYNFGIQTVSMDRQAFQRFMEWVLSNAESAGTSTAPVVKSSDGVNGRDAAAADVGLRKRARLRKKRREVVAAVRSDAAVLLTERQIGADAEELTVAEPSSEEQEVAAMSMEL